MTAIGTVLRFECNAGCGATLEIRTDDYAQLKRDGTYPKEAVYQWLGKRVWEAIGDHLTVCKVVNPHLVGTPWLTLVKP